MAKRCPHCQTRPLRADADTCWYCGKEYRLESRSHRPARPQLKPRVVGRMVERELTSLESR